MIIIKPTSNLSISIFCIIKLGIQYNLSVWLGIKIQEIDDLSDWNSLLRQLLV